MLKFKQFLEEVKKPSGKLKDACWKGYTAVGTKEKNGKTVPNCVPTNEDTDEKKSATDHDKWKEEYKKARAAGSSTANARARANGAVQEETLDEKSPAWQRKEGKSETGGLNKKGIASYRRENPGSKLSMAVTTKPSKLDPDSKAAKRRKSFCARMSGMKKRLTSAKTANDPDSRINKSLRKWNC